MSGRRGFTLMELMIVVSCAGGVTAAAGAYYLTARTAAARTEARLALTRDAAVVAEQVARDLRQADAVATEADAAVVRIGELRVRYHLEDGRLFRETPEGTRLLTRRARAFTLAEGGLGYSAKLAFERPFARGGPVALERTIEVGRRSR